MALTARSGRAAVVRDVWRAQAWSFAPNVTKTPSGKLIFPAMPPAKA